MTTGLWLVLLVLAWVIGVACGSIPFLIGGAVAHRDRQVPTDSPPPDEP